MSKQPPPRSPPSQWPAWLMAACVTAPLASSAASSVWRCGSSAACLRITFSAARVFAANLRQAITAPLSGARGAVAHVRWHAALNY